MILCLVCGHETAGNFRCPRCSQAPTQIDGFPSFAPELAQAVEGFDPAAHAVVARHEAGHFWFQARNLLIVERLRHHFPEAADYLEIGCGTGYVLAAVADAFPALRISGSEALCAGLSFASERVPGARLMQMDARRLPFTAEFDVIGAYDVIEHIHEDETVLAEIRRALKLGGGMIVTVPQHMWLWSAQDERAHHMRRYERGELEDKLRRNGFDVLYSSSFMVPLLPLVWWSRRRRTTPEQIERDELLPSRLANTVLSAMLAGERFLLRLGLRFPAGSSRIVVARRTA